MRASIGNAVIEMDEPTKSQVTVIDELGFSRSPRPIK
jgi:hypothetical protein